MCFCEIILLVIHKVINIDANIERRVAWDDLVREEKGWVYIFQKTNSKEIFVGAPVPVT